VASLRYDDPKDQKLADTILLVMEETECDQPHHLFILPCPQIYSMMFFYGRNQ